MIEECSKEIFEEYQKLSKENITLLERCRIAEPEKEIINLIGDYEAYKQLLIEHEEYYARESTEYENMLYKQKQEYMEEGAKSTEAKEKAKIDLEPSALSLLEIEKDVNILKACIHSVEYQLRLKFQQMKEGYHLHTPYQGIDLQLSDAIRGGNDE